MRLRDISEMDLIKPVVVKRTMADGSIKEYRYDRISRKALKGAPGSAELEVSTLSGRLARNDGRSPESSLHDVITHYRETSEKWQQLAPLTKGLYLRGFDRMIEVFIGWKVNIKTVPIGSITLEDLQDMQQELAKRSVGVANQWANAMSAVFRHARSKFKLTVNPMIGGDDSWRLQLRSWRRWTPQDWQTFNAHAHWRWRWAALVAVITGLRVSDVSNLRWDQFDGRVFRIIQQKTRRTLAKKYNGDLGMMTLPIPIPDALLPLFRAEKEKALANGHEYVVTNRFGKRYITKSFSNRFSGELRRIGLNQKGRPGPDEPGRLTFHGLRKTMAALMATGRASPHEIKARTGHESLASVGLYTEEAEKQALSESGLSLFAPQLAKFLNMPLAIADRSGEPKTEA